MLNHRRLTALTAVGALALAAGCGQSGAQVRDQESSATASPEASSFHDQQIAFEPCDPPSVTPGTDVPDLGYECGVLDVPLDHDDPDGKTAQIALLKVPARGEDPIGSLVLNPGGPGFPGTDLAVTTAQAWAESPVTERFDLVGFDPRGVGRSVPAVDCFTDEQREDDALLITFDDGELELDEQAAAELYDQCAERSGGAESLHHLGTRDVAQDLDVLRAALGDEQLTYVGTSYGTRLGAVYAEMFPENVRALVLDGAMDPFAGLSERREQQAEGMQAVFEQMADACVEQADCPLGSDPQGATEEFQALVRPLIESPVPAGEGRELTFNTALGGVIMGMYTEESWPAVIAGLAEVREGRGDTLLLLADLYQGRTADGTYADSLEAGMAINCLDEERLSPEEISAMTEATFEAAPFLDTGLPTRPSHDVCNQWPMEPTLGSPYATDIDGLTDTLTISATGDPMAPHEGAIRLSDALGGSLLTVEGNQHGLALVDNACIQDTLAAYLIELESPGPDATCDLQVAAG